MFFKTLLVFQTERTPRAVLLVTGAWTLTETIRVPLGSLDASNKFSEVDRAIFHQEFVPGYMFKKVR